MMEWCTLHGLLLTTAHRTGQPVLVKVSAEALLEALIQVTEAAMLAERQ